MGIYWSLFGSVFVDRVIQGGGAITGVPRRRCRVPDGGVGGLLVFLLHSGICVAVGVWVMVWFSRGVWGKAGGDVNSFHCSSPAGLVGVLLYLLVGSLLEGQSRKEEEDNHSAAFPAASTTVATLVMEGISCFGSRDISSKHRVSAQKYGRMAYKQFLMNEGLMVEKKSPAAERKALKSQFSSGQVTSCGRSQWKRTLLCVIRLESAFVFGAKQANLMVFIYLWCSLIHSLSLHVHVWLNCR